MFIIDNEIHFVRSDMNFVSKFGVELASEMVFEYRSRNHLPFIYDTYQLSHFLDLRRNSLFRLTRNYYYKKEKRS